MNTFERIREAVTTLLRADNIEFEPPLRELARSALKRYVDHVEMQVTGVPIEGTEVKIDRLHIVAEDVRLHLALRGTALRIGAATFDATLTQEQLSELVPLPVGVDRLSVTPRGFTFHTVAGIPIYTSVALEDTKIVVSPTAPYKVPFLDLIGIDIDLPELPGSGALEQLTKFGFSFELPALPANARITELVLDDGFVVASGTIDLGPAD